MNQHIGKTVHARNEASPLRILDYRGKNQHGSHVFLCQLHSKATRLYAGQNLLILAARGSHPLIEDDKAQAA